MTAGIHRGIHYTYGAGWYTILNVRALNPKYGAHYRPIFNRFTDMIDYIDHRLSNKSHITRGT